MAKATKVERELREAEATHEGDPERAEVLRRARVFKNSWVELAEALAKVRRDGSFSKWGYPSFDAYAKKELHLRPDTADKLTASFLFLKDKAPGVLERDGIHETMPSWQSVDFLRRTEEKAAAAAPSAEPVDEQIVDEVRKRVLVDAAPVREIAKAYGEKVFPIDPRERAKSERAGIRNVASRLKSLLARAGGVVDAAIVRDADEVLERILAAVAEEEVAA